MAIINTYSKSRNAACSDSQANLACFADQELTCLVLTFMIVCKRLELDALKQSLEYGEQAVVNSRLCFLINKGKPVSAITLGKVFREEFINHGLDITVAYMRHVLEAYARREGCCLEATVAANPLLRFANHSENTSNATYGKGNGKDLPEIPADRMEECYRYSMHWNQHVLGSRSAIHVSP